MRTKARNRERAVAGLFNRKTLFLSLSRLLIYFKQIHVQLRRSRYFHHRFVQTLAFTCIPPRHVCIRCTNETRRHECVLSAHRNNSHRCDAIRVNRHTHGTLHCSDQRTNLLISSKLSFLKSQLNSIWTYACWPIDRLQDRRNYCFTMVFVHRVLMHVRHV